MIIVEKPFKNVSTKKSESVKLLESLKCRKQRKQKLSRVTQDFRTGVDRMTLQVLTILVISLGAVYLNRRRF